MTAAVVAAVLVSTSAQASHIERIGDCYPRAGALAMFLNANPAMKLLGYHHDAAAQALIARYNAFPPPTDFTGDEVLAYGRPDLRFVVFMMFHADCVVLWSELPLFIWWWWEASLARVERMTWRAA